MNYDSYSKEKSRGVGGVHTSLALPAIKLLNLLLTCLTEFTNMLIRNRTREKFEPSSTLFRRSALPSPDANHGCSTTFKGDTKTKKEQTNAQILPERKCTIQRGPRSA